MIRKSLFTLTALFLFPAFANAWYVNAKTSPATGQGTISPSGNLSYPAGTNSGEFTVTPAPGYTVSRVTLDGVALGPNGNGRYVVPYLAGKNWRYLVAYLASGAVQITTQVTAGSGTIREDSNESLSNIPLGSNRQLLVLPSPGYAIASVTADGATITDNGDGSKTVVYANLQSSKSVSASFAPLPQLSVSAGGDVAAYGAGAQFAVALYGSASGNQGAISYSWSGAGLSFGTPNAAVTTVYAASPGSYSATLTASSGSLVRQDSATVTVYNSAEYQSTVCTSCHALSAPQVVESYQASLHSGRTSCQECHSPEPHTGVLPTSAPCAGCHTDASGGFASHPLEIDAVPCLSCHDPHSTAAFAGAPAVHYNNVTSAGYPASYMTSRAKCADCHYGSPENAAIRAQWGASGHAAISDLPWRGEDFKTLSGCVQCHSTTGFIAYSTGRVSAAWGVASDKTKEVLSCVACHKDMATGVLRTVAPVRPYADDSYLNRDLGKSNVCMACHSGTRNGASISAQLAVAPDFGQQPFISPHYLAAGGVLHGKGGYHLPGPEGYAFYSSNTHRLIGLAGSNNTGSGGPCLGCHKSSASDHNFTAGVGEICANCHGAALSEAQLALNKAAFANGLAVLNAMLAVRNHPYSASYPHFSTADWGSGQAGADTMGAAFNYLLLLNDPGGYAHNPAYAKRLIVDSIDFLYNGAVTGSIETALSYLVAQGRITREAADTLSAYQQSSSCASCHSNTSRSHPAHLESGFGCAECHSEVAATSTALVPGNRLHLNGAPDVEAGPGRSFSYSFAASGGTCSSISCHYNGTAIWGGTLGCDGCHDAPPASASHLKHYGGSVAQAGYGNTGITQDVSSNATVYALNCGNCHPLNASKHGNGVVEVELSDPAAPAGSLKALNPGSAAYVRGETLLTDARGMTYSNGTCSGVYCHSYNSWTSSAIPNNDPDWQSKVASTRIYREVTWGGASLACSGCHGNPTQSSFPSNDGGAGDSHSWIDPYGYQNLHTWNMGFAPISCRYCHNETVKQPNSYTYDAMDVRTLSDVPISNFSKHVNGHNDVSFDKENPFVYSSYGGNTAMSLSGATYDPVTKNCSNVSCHIQETVVRWGTPYRWYNYGVECDRCHGYGN